MAVLERFSTPGSVDDLEAGPDRDRLKRSWHETVVSMFERVAEFPQLYDPSAEETPTDAQQHHISWHAFPATLNRLTASAEARVRLADSERELQDEYCEWSVEREGAAIVKVTFTTEVREYFSELFNVDREAVLDLYHQHVSTEVQMDDLVSGDRYNPRNGWNTRTNGPIMHLSQSNNNLAAAVKLAGDATVLRERNGTPVTGQQELVACGKFGNEFRNSDPQIASAINGLAAIGALITLRDPIGLYIDRLETAGMTFPGGVEVDDCWIVERGDEEHVVRARFEVPADKGTVSDVRIDGIPIRAGAQLADRVVVRIGALSHSAGTRQPRIEECQ